MQGIAALPTVVSLAASVHAGAAAPACKAFPGSASWPSIASWDKLNDTLGGRLLTPVPPAAVCHPEQATYNADACTTLTQQWTSFDFHTRDPVSIMWEQFSNDTCLPDPKYPCSASGYPPYVVNATTPEHVQAGVNFARENDVRLVVKGTGHDDNGRSIAPFALSIWTHHMQDIAHHRGEFKFAGSNKRIKGNAITVGAGVQMYDVYTATAKNGETIVGGGGKSVGLGGYITGGGHSILAARYGLAADNVLQMEMVTPGGDFLTINEDQNRDLFWAMRGGGGSTFGVITSFTLKTHPSPKIAFANWYAVAAAESPVAFDVIAYVLSQFPSLMDKGVSGYFYVARDTPNPIPSPELPETITGVLGGFMLQDVSDGDKLQALLKPLNDTINARWNGTAHILQQTVLYDSFLDWFNVNYDQGVAGANLYRASRLVGRKALTGDVKALAEAYKAATEAGGAITAYLVAGEGVRNAKPQGGANAVNPAWRSAYIQSLTGVAYAPFNKTAEDEVIRALDKSLQPLKKLTPNSGAYINEGFLFEKDWQKTFWGDNYQRLLKIKKKVDPKNVFVKHGEMFEFPDGLRMGQLFDLFFAMVYLEPAVGIHDAFVEWKLPVLTWKDQACTCDDALETSSATSHKDAKKKQDWDIAIEETYHSDDVPDACTHSLMRPESYEHKCMDRSGCTYITRRRASIRWMFQSEDFVDGFMAFGTTMEDRAHFVEKEFARLKIETTAAAAEM
ncbi:transmembrane alpha-helix domain-containing protein [Purpureocillium lavendulum]|uniref:Transmembrane alpha-helix domain-containing protein n=1 Tax=Purpureocillium lavendulum TaxID=1247861 RepID=A0AB34G853_9HYPO|nr:transmembrane alpha-helix domain-containing protein [Purpureocillium lavendulum]